MASNLTLLISLTMRLHIDVPPNERGGVDAGTALCLHSGRQRLGATHRGC
jgi:hypothetical protein